MNRHKAVSFLLRTTVFTMVMLTLTQAGTAQTCTNGGVCNPSKLNNIRYVDGVTFTNVAAAINDIVNDPSVMGGIVVSTRPEVFASDPFVPAYNSHKSILLMLGAGIWSTNVTITLN